MTNVLTPSLTISGSLEVVRERILPMIGTVSVTEGQEVFPDTVIAESARPGELHIVRVSDALGLNPEDAMPCVTVVEGSKVSKGDVLAESSTMWGLLRSTVLSPVDGVVEFVTPATGHLGIREPSTKVTVAAYIQGKIRSIYEERGALIATQAVFVQGIFGVGGEKTGIIHMLDVLPNDAVGLEHLPQDCRGKILIGGRSPSLEVLEKAKQDGAVGFVTASIDDLALSGFIGYDIGIALTGDEDLSMSLIITEGFGDIGLNPTIQSLLEVCDGKLASINGATQVRAGAVRPEIVVSHGVLEQSLVNKLIEQSTTTIDGCLQVGSVVRIIRVPYFGKQATVVDLPTDLVPLATEAMARVVTVRLHDSNAEVVIPRANVELVL
jgi:hypothetical protein